MILQMSPGCRFTVTRMPPRQKYRCRLSDHSHIGIQIQNQNALNLRLLWNRHQSYSVCILLISLSRLCLLCHGQSPIQLGKKKIRPFPLFPSQFMAWSLQILNQPTVSMPSVTGLCPRFQFQSKTSLGVPVSCPLSSTDLDPIPWTSSMLNPASVLSP